MRGLVVLITKNVNIYNNKMLLFSHICSGIYNTAMFLGGGKKKRKREKKNVQGPDISLQLFYGCF